PFIDCAGSGIIQHIKRATRPRPVGDDAVFCIENECGGRKIGGGIGYDPGWTAGAARIICGAGYRHYGCLLIALGVVNSRCTAIVVCDPERISWQDGNPPGISQLRIGMSGNVGQIRYQVGLLVSRLLSRQCCSHWNSSEQRDEYWNCKRFHCFSPVSATATN